MIRKLNLNKEYLSPIEKQFNFNNIEIERKIIMVFVKNHYNEHCELLKKLTSLHIQLTGYFFAQARIKKEFGLAYDENIVLNNAVLNHFYLPLSILELLKNGYYGSARVLLRQSFEMLIIAKYCEYNLKARTTWQNNEQIKIGNIFSYIRNNGKSVDELQRIWKELCKYTHGTPYAQELLRLPYIEDKEKIINMIEKSAQESNFSSNLSYTFDLFFVSLNMLFHLDNKFHNKVRRFYFGDLEDPFGFYMKIKKTKNDAALISDRYYSMIKNIFVKEEGIMDLKKIIRQFKQEWS